MIIVTRNNSGIVLHVSFLKGNAAFFPFSLYSNPSGMPPYTSQGFPCLPPYPPQEANRNISLSVADTVSSSTTSCTPAKPAAPSFGILSNLPLPVPTADTATPVGIFSYVYFLLLIFNHQTLQNVSFCF